MNEAQQSEEVTKCEESGYCICKYSLWVRQFTQVAGTGKEMSLSQLIENVGVPT